MLWQRKQNTTNINAYWIAAARFPRSRLFHNQELLKRAQSGITEVCALGHCSNWSIRPQ
jgi:hypothetical protein